MVSKALLFAEIDRLSDELKNIVADKTLPLDVRKRALTALFPTSANTPERLVNVFCEVPSG